jgi:protein disulfide-isomerase A3
LKVAKKLLDDGVKAGFAVSNAEEFRQELTEFGIDDVKKDGKYALARGPNNEKYRMSGEFTYEALEEFARKLAKGELEAYMKSQPIPPQTDDVKVVVGRNFEEIVNDESKDVLIEFYAPW